jgi:hypothetical protein
MLRTHWRAHSLRYAEEAYNMHYTVGTYLAARLSQIGLKHHLAVAGDFNLLLLDQLLKNKDLDLIEGRGIRTAVLPFADASRGDLSGACAQIITDELRIDTYAKTGGRGALPGQNHIKLTVLGISPFGWHTANHTTAFNHSCSLSLR